MDVQNPAHKNNMSELTGKLFLEMGYAGLRLRPKNVKNVDKKTAFFYTQK
jgi:hypothetical protein